MTDATEVRDPIKDQAESTTPGAGGPQTARRRLMLGAAAALPSVFTLTSGAQTAVASNLRCLAKGSLDSQSVSRLTLTKDEWLRKEVYFGVENGHEAYCAMDDQALCLEPMNPSKPAIGSVWIRGSDRVTVGPQVSITQISSKPQAHALVFVNEDGTIITLDPTAERMHPVMETCFTSILGGRLSPLG
jgi:hypothetical protein